MSFNDAAEVRQYLGGVFEAAFADPEIAPQLQGTGIVLKTVYTDPAAVVVIDTAAGTVELGDASTPSTATMTMTADTGNAYWQGKVNLPLAMAKSRIKVEGNVASLLKLAPLGKKLYPRYIATLQADGRDDLLV
ncbi:SCP2 sterol-binding domain-containing protein [Nocardioides zeae]|uniref:Sterol carrier protein n=1 Tax=Nocardioides zeae TaxID=1457234 RepID=A0A6P0HGF4_9ACTN|nr:SCP2 sterol-binding domain-containing protein [Nocardioides zeae]NEN77606.1 sterol carrier protein [Nocardioides zeae]